MKRYRFLLLAFFLCNGAYASGLMPVSVAPNTLANVNSTPDLRSNVNNSVPDIKNKSSMPSRPINTIPGPSSTPSVDNGVNTIPTTNSAPAVRRNGRQSATSVDIRRTSPRNTTEIGGTIEPAISGTRNSEAELNSVSSARRTNASKEMKTSSNGMSCKTYEGKIYDQGEAGYSDCMRNIRTDRQGTRSVP